jgi:hypothetical protein
MTKRRAVEDAPEVRREVADHCQVRIPDVLTGSSMAVVFASLASQLQRHPQRRVKGIRLLRDERAIRVEFANGEEMGQ